MGSRHWAGLAGARFYSWKKRRTRGSCSNSRSAAHVPAMDNGWIAADDRPTQAPGAEGSTVVANSLSTLSSPQSDLSATRRWDYESPRPSWKHDGSVLHGRQIYLSDHPPAGETCVCVCVCFCGFSFPCHGPRLTPPAPPPRHRRLLRASVRGAGGRGDRVSWEGGRGRGVRLTASWSAPVHHHHHPHSSRRGMSRRWGWELATEFVLGCSP